MRRLLMLVLATAGLASACETPTSAEADTAISRAQPPPRAAPRERPPPRTLTEHTPTSHIEQIVRSRYAELLPLIVADLVKHPTFVDEVHPDAEPAARGAFFDSLEMRARMLSLTFRRATPLVVEIELPADGPSTQVIGILAHGDVVPPGDGWSVPPFSAERKDGRIYGRGTMDDKGPIAAALVAMAALRDARTPRPFTTRLIVGMAEETTWDCMQGYLKGHRPPDFTMVVDGSFPVGIGEKGIAGVKVAEPFSPAAPSDGRCAIRSLSGGTAGNVVPDAAQATVACAGDIGPSLVDKLIAHGVSARSDAGGLLVEARGRAAHGSTPEQGANALSLLLGALDQTVPLDDAAPGTLLVHFLARHAADNSGASVGVDATHPRFTPATLNLGKLRVDGGAMVASLSIRFLPPASVDSVIASVRRAADGFAAGRAGRLLVEGRGLPPLYVDPSRAEVRALLSAYGNVTGSEPHAVTLSGTTYAKALPNAVSFGPEPDGAPERRHAPDEYISVEELVNLARVYAAALTTLAQQPQEEAR